jgi:uridine phosphorylase
MAAGMLEEARAGGCQKFVACGGAGAVTPGTVVGHVVVPDAGRRAA